MKTELADAFFWCLHGKHNYRPDETKQNISIVEQLNRIHTALTYERIVGR